MTDPMVATPQQITSTRNWWIGICVALCAAIGIAIVVAGVTDEPANSGFVDGAAVLAFITGIAVAVERVIELIWARVDSADQKGAWWPLSVVTGALHDVETKTNEVLTPFANDVGKLLTDLDGWVGTDEEKASAVQKVAAQIEERAAVARQAIANAQKLAPGSSRFAAIARATDDFAHDAALVARKAGVWSAALERSLRAAGDTLSSAQDVVGAFKDNPARKTMSIALGVPLGVLASGVVRLNMFSAVLGPDTPGYMTGVMGIVGTGVVMGLGSNPTHEVIKALQRRQLDATIDVPVGSTVQPTTIELPAGGLGAAGSSRVGLLQTDAAGSGVPTMVVTSFVSDRQARPIRNAG